MEITFAYPFVLGLLILVPMVPALYWWGRRRRARVQLSVFGEVSRTAGKRMRWLPWLQMAAAMVVMALLVVALASPQKTVTEEQEGKKGIDIVLALDVSDSMRAQDLSPNRLEAAKEGLNRFVSDLSDDRVGVVVFAGKAFTQSPLTFDYGILQEYLKGIDTTSVNQGVRGLAGTAIGDAILAGVQRLGDDDERSRVLVLLTDGDANVGIDPMIAAQKAADEGVVVYTIGIGRDGGAPIPVTDALGRNDVARDRNGQPVLATFNEESLREIASVGGGSYFRVNDEAGFEQVLEEIGELEKKEIEVGVREYYENVGWPLVVLVGVSLVVFVLLVSVKPIRS